jgi:hypothetical protein
MDRSEYLERLSPSRALEGAESKAAGLFPPDLARRLLNASPSDHALIRWIEAPPMDSFLEDVRGLGEELLRLDPRPLE